MTCFTAVPSYNGFKAIIQKYFIQKNIKMYINTGMSIECLKNTLVIYLNKILNHISHICRMLCKVIVLYTFSFVSSLNIWRLFYQNGARIQNTYSFCRGKTTRQQMKKHPPSYWTVTGWVIRQLLADLAKYLVPGETKKYSINRHSVLVSIPKLVWTLNFDFHNFSQNLNLDCVEKKYTGILNCKNDLLKISFTVLHYSVSIATWVPVCRFQERRHIGLSPGPC